MTVEYAVGDPRTLEGLAETIHKCALRLTAAERVLVFRPEDPDFSGAMNVVEEIGKCLEAACAEAEDLKGRHDRCVRLLPDVYERVAGRGVQYQQVEPDYSEGLLAMALVSYCVEQALNNGVEMKEAVTWYFSQLRAERLKQSQPPGDKTE